MRTLSRKQSSLTVLHGARYTDGAYFLPPDGGLWLPQHATGNALAALRDLLQEAGREVREQPLTGTLLGFGWYALPQSSTYLILTPVAPIEPSLNEGLLTRLHPYFRFDPPGADFEFLEEIHSPNAKAVVAYEHFLVDRQGVQVTRHSIAISHGRWFNSQGEVGSEFGPELLGSG